MATVAAARVAALGATGNSGSSSRLPFYSPRPQYGGGGYIGQRGHNQNLGASSGPGCTGPLRSCAPQVETAAASVAARMLATRVAAGQARVAVATGYAGVEVATAGAMAARGTLGRAGRTGSSDHLLCARACPLRRPVSRHSIRFAHRASMPGSFPRELHLSNDHIPCTGRRRNCATTPRSTRGTQGAARYRVRQERDDTRYARSS